jgi:hypothetical protein
VDRSSLVARVKDSTAFTVADAPIVDGGLITFSPNELDSSRTWRRISSWLLLA